MPRTTKARNMRTFLNQVALEEAQIRQRIREARLEAGLTQEQAADLVVVHKRTWENWERGAVGIPWDQIENIAKKLNKTPEWLLHGDDYIASSDVKQIVEGAVAKEIAGLSESLERMEKLLRERLGD